MIRIGIDRSKLGQQRGHYLSSKLEENSHPNSFIELVDNENYLQKEQALLTHAIDTFVCPLTEVPIPTSPGVVIGGLSDRFSAKDLLIVHPDKLNSSRTLKLNPGAIIGVHSDRQRVLMNHIIPGLNFRQIQNGSDLIPESLSDGQLDGVVLAHSDIQMSDINLDKWHIQLLNPIEFVPSPGQGVWAYLVRENDLETRKAIYELHHTDVSQLTNIERQTLALFQSESPILGLHCSKDANNFYHLYGMYANSPDSAPVFHRISQSTTHKLSERMFEALSVNHKN